MRESALNLAPEVRAAQRARYEYFKTLQVRPRMFWPASKGTRCEWVRQHKAALREHVARGFIIPESSR